MHRNCEWNGSPRFHVRAEGIVHCSFHYVVTRSMIRKTILGFFFFFCNSDAHSNGDHEEERKHTSWELTGSSRHDIKKHNFLLGHSSRPLPLRLFPSTIIHVYYVSLLAQERKSTSKIFIIIFIKMMYTYIFCKYNGIRHVLSIFHLSLNI